jgi:hypothetical protein
VRRGLIRTQHNLLMFTLSVVSVFGSFGCSDRAEQDSWEPGRPVAVFSAEDGEKKLDLIPVLNESLPADARITFPGDEIESLNVRSTCRSRSEKNWLDERTDWQGQNTSSVEIRNLLPTSVWKRLDFRGLKDVACHLEFNLKSRRGSLWSFTLPSVAIDSFDRLPNFKMEDLKFTPEVSSDIDLICDHFVNSQKGVHKRSSTEVYQALVFGPAPDAQSELSRRRYNHQVCRLAIETFDVRSNRQRHLSEPFTESFLGPGLEITASLDLSGSIIWSSTSVEKRNVLNVSIKNPSPVHVAIRLHNLWANNLLIQNYSRTAPDYYQVVEEYPVTLHYAWSGQSNTIEESAPPLLSNRIFEIPPGGTFQLTAQVSTGMACWLDRQTTDWMRWQLPYPNVSIPVGYAYKFAGNVFLTRLLNWDPSAPQPGSPTEDLNVLESAEPSDEQGVYHGRSILSHWAHSDQPQIVPIVKTTLPPGTYCNGSNDIYANMARPR